MKRCSTTLATREIQTKAMMRPTTHLLEKSIYDNAKY